jgi:2-amino-4-hydroxy-6-hydroxymethyldihydropteridine diphosphokinase
VPPIAYVGLGSNRGRREELILAAARALEEGGVARLTRLSALYETDPVGIAGARRFVNAVAEVVPLLPALDLLERFKAIEAGMGRTGGHHQSREIDLDLVTYGEELVASDALVLPHPRFHERAFVAIPLREIAPRFVCPRTGRTIDEIVARLGPGAKIDRISGRTLVVRG